MMLPLHLIGVYLTLYSFVLVSIWGVANSMAGWNPVEVVKGWGMFSWPWIVGWGFLGMYISHAIRQSVHLKDHREDWPLFFLYIPIMIFVFIPLTIYALFTMWETGWLVRGNSGQQGAVKLSPLLILSGIAALILIGTGLFFWLAPGEPTY